MTCLGDVLLIIVGLVVLLRIADMLDECLEKLRELVRLSREKDKYDA